MIERDISLIVGKFNCKSIINIENKMIKKYNKMLTSVYFRMNLILDLFTF